DRRIGPQLGFSRSAAAGKNADDVPHILADPKLMSDVEALEGAGGTGSDDDLTPAGLEFSAFDDFDVATNGQGGGADATERNVGIGLRRTFGEVDDDEELAGSERAIVRAGESGRIGDHTNIVAC